MLFAKTFLISTLCISVSTSVHLDITDADCRGSDHEGRCLNPSECNYPSKFHKMPLPCNESHVCCPLVTFEGDECEDIKSGLNGICQNLSECNYAWKYGKVPEYCNDQTVCCPPVQLRISERMCFKYYRNGEDYLVDIERFTSGYNYTGKPALRKYSYRHLAAIGFPLESTNNKILWACGGSIISPSFILSSAACFTHSVKDIRLGRAKWVKIGYIDLRYSREDESDQHFRIVEIFIHPDYTSPASYNDIALVKLEKEIIFGHDFQPACLHTEKNVPEIMEATGWGSSEDTGYYLLIEDLNIVDYKKCLLKFKDDYLPKGVIDELQICAWDLSRKKGTCPTFYTGGSLQYKVEGFENFRGRYVVAGVTSITEACAHRVNAKIFTRVSTYLDWIEEIVWENAIELETVTFIFSN